MCFSKRMKQSRERQGMTLAELGRKIGKTEATVQRYESGNIKNLKNDTIENIAKALNVNPAFLMGWIDGSEQEDIVIALYHDIIENLEDLTEKNAPLVNDFIEEVIKEQNNKSTLIPETTRIQNRLSYSRQHNVLGYANHQLELQNSTKNNVIDIDTYKNKDITEVNINGFAAAGIGETLFDEPKFKVPVKGYVPPHDIALQVNGDSMEPMFSDKEIIFVEKSNDIKNGQIGVFIIDGEAYVKKVHVGEDKLTLVSLNKDYRDLHFYENESVRLVGRVIL